MRLAPNRSDADLDPQYQEVIEHFDTYVADADRWSQKTDAYHGLVARIYRALIPPGSRVLEIGCGRGDLLSSLQPSRGVGVDVSEQMIEDARRRHPDLEFRHQAGESLDLDETFDYVVLADLVPYVYDLQAVVSVAAKHCHSRSRVIANTYSNLWRIPLAAMRKLGYRPDRPTRNWVAPRDLVNLFELGGLEAVIDRREILLPTRSRALSVAVNGLLARLPLVRQLALSYWLIARPVPQPEPESGVTVVVPCRNEAGSIESIVERVPEMGSGTEILFVEGGSTDDTRDRIAAEIDRRRDRDMRLLVQSGAGKANAVHEAFEEADHDILMILDADLTVAPEDLPKFYEAIVSGRGDLINGSRLVYGMEPGAMRFLNLLGNRVFASVLSFVLGQYVKDTLCGTKALRRSDYERIMAQRHEIAGEDPFGDFDFLLGASLVGMKILNVPVRYGARTYGETNIQRFQGGGKLARLAVGGYRRIWIEPVER